MRRESAVSGQTFEAAVAMSSIEGGEAPVPDVVRGLSQEIERHG